MTENFLNFAAKKFRMTQITIHRGTEQVGGCLTEICTDGARVFVDMGDNLPGEQAQLSDAERIALVDGLFAQNKKAAEAVV